MASAVAGGLSRVTIVSPRSRVDLALPSDIPLADLMPTLLAYAGEDLASEGLPHGGWVLSRLSGQALDAGRSASQLQVRDGEVLYFTPPASNAPEIMFDDVIDAVATATKRRGGRWSTEDARRSALAIGVTALLGGALVTLTAGPPQLPAAVVGFTMSFVLLIAAAMTSRAVGDSGAGVAIGACAVVYAGVGGLLLMAGDRHLTELGAPQYLVGAGALLLAASLAAVGVVRGAPAFLALAAGAALLTAAASICQLFGVDAAAAVAVVVCLALVTLPMLPMLAYRMARLPIPSLPSGADELKAESETVDRARVLAGAERVHGSLTGALGTVAVVCGVGSVVLALTGDRAALAMATVVSLLNLSRSRPFLTRSHRVPMLASGVVGLIAAGVSAFNATDSDLSRLALLLGATALTALISFVFAVSGAGRKASPIAGRALDVVETLLVLAVVPLAAWVCGLFHWIRAIHG